MWDFSKLFKAVWFLILLAFVNGLYLISLGKCPYDYSDPNKCIGYFRKMYAVWLFNVIISGIIWYAAFALAVYRVFPKISIIILFINAMSLFFYKSGMRMEDHGGINRFGFAWTITVLAIFHCIFAIMKKIYQFRKSLFVIVLLLVALFMLAFYILRINNSWDGWTNGLKNHQLINDGKHWHVPIPTFWELGIRNNWFDFNKFTKQWSNLAQTFDRSILLEKLK